MTHQTTDLLTQPSTRERSNPQRIAIVGTGYVGLTTGACLAHLGFNVTCCDIDVDKIACLLRGEVPIVEEGLAEIIHAARSAGHLEFAVGSDPAVRDADIVFLCVPTPQDEDGSADLQYVRAAARELGHLLPTNSIVVNKSTVPVGSIDVVSEALGRPDVQVVSNPEFLREGSAVGDFLNPDRVVIGSNDRDAASRVAALYEQLDTQIIFTDPSSAELIKYAANGFLAMKISFVNSVAALCEQVGADVASVVDGIGSDHRIGHPFLNPGPGWGGSCFPKDSRALVAIAAEHDYDFSLMRGVIDINEQQYERMVHKVAKAVGRREGERLDGIVVGALGLTFKAGTDDLRESPSINVLSRLRALGAIVAAYDPTTSDALSPIQLSRLADFELSTTAIDALTGADVAVLLTEWPEFVELDIDKVAHVMRGDAFVDCRNLLDGDVFRAVGLRYEGVGRS
jgi:UDPglucose 6-dehydrogenase